MGKFYTGVGSRKAPVGIRHTISKLAARLAAQGWILRSGGAVGCDSAFASGAGNPAEIFRPEHATADALAMAAKVHPAWARCNHYVRNLHARNCFQVLGKSLDCPSSFLVCWTQDGATSAAECSIRTGGTATAIRLADANGVPVFNLAREDHLARVEKFLAE